MRRSLEKGCLAGGLAGLAVAGEGCLPRGTYLLRENELVRRGEPQPIGVGAVPDDEFAAALHESEAVDIGSRRLGGGVPFGPSGPQSRRCLAHVPLLNSSCKRFSIAYICRLCQRSR